MIVSKTHPGYEYLEAEVLTTIADAANHAQTKGWETIGIIPPAGLTLGFSLLLKRPKRNPYVARPAAFEGEMTEWQAWEIEHGGVDWR